MIKFLSSLVITILLLSCAVEKEKLTENVGKYVPPNIDDTNFKNSVITNKILICWLIKVDMEVDKVNVDPYGPDSDEFIVGKDFAHMWTSALAFCQKRYEGKAQLYKKGPTGGLGCFTPDNFPIFDNFREIYDIR